MNPLKNQLCKYFIMGSQDCSGDPVKILEEAIQGGITAFQYREKGEGSLTGKAKVRLGKQLRAICLQHDIPFFINDDIELVDVLHVDGIHVGQDDMPVEEIRRLYPDKIIGLSVSNLSELNESTIEFVDYIGAGAVFPTTTKEDADKAVGLEWITTLKQLHPALPIIGIGGIDEHNADKVRAAGADGVSVISAITKANNIQEVVRHL